MSEVNVKNLNVWFKDNHVLKDVSISIKENAVTAIMGPSGCGKTTIIRAINRMNDVIPGSRTTGEIIINGKNVYDRNADVYELRRKVGMVFQKPNPFPKTICENVAYGLRIHSMAKKEELLKIVERSLREAALWDEVK